MSEKLKRCSNSQMKALLDVMETSPELLAGGYIGPHGRVNTLKKWEDISVGLNELGTAKSARQWAKTWTDWRYHTRQKAVKIKRAKAGIEGSVLTVTPLNSIEARLLNMVGIGNGQAFVQEDYDLPNAENVTSDIEDTTDMSYNNVKSESRSSSTESQGKRTNGRKNISITARNDDKKTEELPIEIRLLKLEEEKLEMKVKKMKLKEKQLNFNEKRLALKRKHVDLLEKQTTALCAIVKVFKTVFKEKRRDSDDSD